MSWTPEREEKLKELWKKGLTGSEIAKTFNTTRSAILGKVHRLKLEARAVSKKTLATPKTKLENSVEIKQFIKEHYFDTFELKSCCDPAIRQLIQETVVNMNKQLWGLTYF